MASIGWLLTFLAFLGLELLCGCFVSLWFASGSVGAWIGCQAGLSMEGQLAVFLAVSFLTLILLRPAAFLFAGRGRAGRHHEAAD